MLFGNNSYTPNKNTCEKGHKRIFGSFVLMQQKTDPSKYSCNYCKETFQNLSCGTFRCKDCNNDICEKCCFLTKQQKDEQPNCQKGHILSIIHKGPGSTFDCNICAKKFEESGKATLRCFQCDYDICCSCTNVMFPQFVDKHNLEHHQLKVLKMILKNDYNLELKDLVKTNTNENGKKYVLPQKQFNPTLGLLNPSVAQPKNTSIFNQNDQKLGMFKNDQINNNNQNTIQNPGIFGNNGIFNNNNNGNQNNQNTSNIVTFTNCFGKLPQQQQNNQQLFQNTTTINTNQQKGLFSNNISNNNQQKGLFSNNQPVQKGLFGNNNIQGDQSKNNNNQAPIASLFSTKDKNNLSQNGLFANQKPNQYINSQLFGAQQNNVGFSFNPNQQQKI